MGKEWVYHTINCGMLVAGLGAFQAALWGRKSRGDLWPPDVPDKSHLQLYMINCLLDGSRWHVFDALAAAMFFEPAGIINQKGYSRPNRSG